MDNKRMERAKFLARFVKGASVCYAWIGYLVQATLIGNLMEKRLFKPKEDRNFLDQTIAAYVVSTILMIMAIPAFLITLVMKHVAVDVEEEMDEDSEGEETEEEKTDAKGKYIPLSKLFKSKNDKNIDKSNEATE